MKRFYLKAVVNFYKIRIELPTPHPFRKTCELLTLQRDIVRWLEHHVEKYYA